MGKECLENVLISLKIKIIVTYVKICILTISDVSTAFDLEREPTESAVGTTPAEFITGLYTHPGWCIIHIIYKN